jgi:hypothetical protein
MNPLNIYKHLKIIKLQNQLINSPYYIVTSNTNYLNKITNLNNILIEKIIFNFFLKKFNLKFPSIFLKYPLNYSHYDTNSNLIFYILNNLTKNKDAFLVILKYNKYLFLNNFNLNYFLQITSYFAFLYKFKKLNNQLFKLFFISKKK